MKKTNHHNEVAMEINIEKLKAIIESIIVPQWNGTAKERWDLRKGGGERYHQEKVLFRAAPELSRESLQGNAKASVLNALKYHKNLLSAYETMFAKVFLDRIVEKDLRTHMIEFLYGEALLEDRLRNILAWAAVKPLTAENKKYGFSPQVVSYLLAMSDARKYPYYKPRAYNSAVDKLIGPGAQPSNPVDRIVHCQAFYSQILTILESDYDLENGNLLDVHSLFYMLDQLKWGKVPSNGGRVDPMDDSVYSLLMEKHNIVFYGPPGTGKTRQALFFAKGWAKQNGPDSVDQITFHPSYSYEDFIEGFRPDLKGEQFVLKDGIFKTICAKAIKNPGKKFLLIIDEINRGDVARILGELITLIEGDKRGNAFATILRQSGSNFYVPENLYIIGTMNTADKSINLMDLAIRRRFLFIPCLPEPDLLNEENEFCDNISDIVLSQLMINLNQRLMNAGIDRDRILGHSYFMIKKDSPSPLDVLMNRIRYEIIPIVEEYCYSDRTLMGSILGGLVDDSGGINNDVFESTDNFVEALKAIADA